MTTDDDLSQGGNACHSCGRPDVIQPDGSVPPHDVLGLASPCDAPPSIYPPAMTDATKGSDLLVPIDLGETEMTATARKAVRLTPPMVELLTDIATRPQMYITRGSRWSRTAGALLDRGLAVIPRGNYGGPQYALRITDDGRAEAARRGITGAQP